MEQVWLEAALWLVLAFLATLLSSWLRISTALSAIVVGTVAQSIVGASIGTEALRFGAIPALFGLNRQIIHRAQDSHLAATVLIGAVAPTAIANAYFPPGRILPGVASKPTATARIGKAKELAEPVEG